MPNFPKEHSPALSRNLGGVAALGLIAVAWMGSLFWAAGTCRWREGWVYSFFVIGVALAHRTWVARRNPDLVIRRRAIGKGTPVWDIVWSVLVWPLMALVAVIGALDAVRWRQSSMPGELLMLGAALIASGFFLSAWAMGINPHFEGTVRVQNDRNHRVIDTGPYSRIRHPGYCGLILWVIGTPFMVGSWLAFLPAAVAVGWIVLRAILEERFLQRKLDGYTEYSARVKRRFIPWP